MKIYKLNIPHSKNEINIGFDSSIKAGGIIQNFKHFEYLSPAEYETSSGKVKLHVLRFKDINQEKEEIIFSILSNYVETLDERRTTILDILETFSDYFSKKDDDFIIQKLIGDLGEIIFVLKLQELGIDYRKYYQLTEMALFDFNFNNHFVDVKTTSQYKKTIYLTKRQIEAEKDVSFLVCEINKMSGKSNIIDLLNMVNDKNDIINEKIKYWTGKLKTNSNIINSWTVDFQDVVTYFVDDKTIPSVSVLKNGGLIDMQLKISVASSEKKPISEIKKFIEKKAR